MTLEQKLVVALATHQSVTLTEEEARQVLHLLSAADMVSCGDSGELRDAIENARSVS